MSFEVCTSRRADRDVERAASWIKRHVSPVAATRWQNCILKNLLSLSIRPDRCPEAEEAACLGLDLRVLLSGRRPHVYRILFTIDGDAVNVIRILHAARDRVDPDAI